MHSRSYTAQTPSDASTFCLSLGKHLGCGPQSVCVPFPSDKVTKSPISGREREESDALRPFGPSLPSSSSFSYVAAADAAAGGLISPGKGQKDGGKGNERRKVGRIIHVDDEEDEDADEGEDG